PSQASATPAVGVTRTGHGIPTAGWPDGSGYTHYKWRLDTNAWSMEAPINTPISLSGLADGLHYVEVTGRSDAGFYQDDPAFEEDAAITRSRTWTVQTSGLPVIVTQPQNYTVAVGCDATFKVVATSPLPLNYQWKRNVADIPGATNDTLTVHNVSVAENSQQYSVVVSNAVGSVTSSNAVLTVTLDVTPPLITAQPQSQTAVAGTNITFTVVASSQCGN